jgi:DNA-binding FrmR family transcriptional regulator
MDQETNFGLEEPCCAAAEGMPGEIACSCRTKQRTPEELQDLVHRLSRIEGQIRGIRGMVERDAYCIDILNQVSAASSALGSFTRVLLTSHIRSCVAEDIRAGQEDKLEELVKTLQKLMK